MSARGLAARSTRRGFLMAAGGVGVGLVIGSRSFAASSTGDEPEATFNPFVRIDPDGIVTVVSKYMEMGQGTPTGLALIVADELDADWALVQTEIAPTNPSLYGHPEVEGLMITAGSSSIRRGYDLYRRAGATARAVLLAEAAERLAVPAEGLTVDAGRISTQDGRSVGFGVLAEAAAMREPPSDADLILKTKADLRLTGGRTRRLDTPAKIAGEPMFTQDFTRPGMMIAAMAYPPTFGARVARFDDTEARAIRDVVDVVEIPEGVAVIARNTWAAFRGRDALHIEWDERAAEQRSSDGLMAAYRARLDERGDPALVEGDAETAIRQATQAVQLDFEFPFLAHAAMETMDVVVELTPGEWVTVWHGAQMPTADRTRAAAVAGMSEDQVEVITLPAGGSFGRRAMPTGAFVGEAVAIAMATGGRFPIKLVHARQDDLRSGYYRPMYAHRLRAGLDREGLIQGWVHRIVGQSILSSNGWPLPDDNIDATTTEGAVQLPYDTGAIRVETTNTELAIPVLWWRSVGSSHNAYSTEVMMDALARAAGRDPLQFRLDHLREHPRHRGVLELAAERAGWRRGDPKLGQGIAVHQWFGTTVAVVADVRLRGGRVSVEKLTCAIDCGLAVMPDQVIAQCEGAMGYGLGPALRNEITLTDGVVDQSDFFDYDPMRMSDLPAMEVHIVPSDEPPTGVGEPATTVVAPAIANAIASLTGDAITVQPLSRAGFT
ncbi:MAG: molybdopterin cofactor-binding domain-containing protein [Pseudomonadota bacterium]